MTKRLYTALLLVLLSAFGAGAQTISDSSNRRVNIDSAMRAPVSPLDRKADSVRRLHSPRKAAIRSAILPGLGQIYNHKYWKLPLVYAAVGIPTALFIYNLTWYRRTRFAYAALVNNDSIGKTQVHPQLQNYIARGAAGNLANLRNEFRRDLDYSGLFIIIMWGLQVVDASVDAHLKTFDVSPDLSLRLKGGYSEMAGTNGVSLVLSFR
ncbi:MAG: hypothetical protein EOO16_18460 [Chitinophagaceae bacterium]|nr:MAG: hypothetical protein EOO16_18460 [Chitinophagaceae bacterium]